MKRWQRILTSLAIVGVLGGLTTAVLPGGRAEAAGPSGVPQQGGATEYVPFPANL